MALVPLHVAVFDVVFVGIASWLAAAGAHAEPSFLRPNGGPTVREWLLLLLVTPVAAPTILLPYATGAISEVVLALLMIPAYWVPAMYFVMGAVDSGEEESYEPLV